MQNEELRDYRDDKGRFAEGNNIAHGNIVYKSVEELESRIDSYFNSLESLNENPTLSGLALHLGFCDKKSLKDYENLQDSPFPPIIKRATARIEKFWENNLGKPACAGSIFWLKNRGWKDNPDANTLTDNGLREIMSKIRPSVGVLPRDLEK